MQRPVTTKTECTVQIRDVVIMITKVDSIISLSNESELRGNSGGRDAQLQLCLLLYFLEIELARIWQRTFKVIVE